MLASPAPGSGGAGARLTLSRITRDGERCALSWVRVRVRVTVRARVRARARARVRVRARVRARIRGLGLGPGLRGLELGLG